METNWSSLHKTLSDNTRKNILTLLSERGALNYTEIMTTLSINNTGRLNYHLKALTDLIMKDADGRYRLTEKGQLAANMLKTFPERIQNGSSNLRKLVSVVLISVGILMIAPVIALGAFFLAVHAALAEAFLLFLTIVLVLGLVLAIVGFLTYKNQLLKSI